MKKSIIFILSFFTTTSMMAQLQRPYSDGTLSFMDFQADALDIESTSGQIYFEYDVMDTAKEIDGVEFKIQQYLLGMNARQSWIDINNFNSDGLAYFQLLFDLEYVTILKANSIIIESPMGYDQKKIDRLNTDKGIIKSKIEAETKNGMVPAKIQKWRDKIKSEIESIGQVVSEPFKLKHTFGMEAYFGVGYNYKSNEIKEYFGNNLGISFGMNFNIREIYLIMSGTIGLGNMPQESCQSHHFG